VSEFFDWTEFDVNMSDEEPLEDYEYVATARWFDPGEALPTLEAVLAHLKQHPGMLKSPDWEDLYEPVVEELEDVVAKVKRAATEGSRFNLCVVM
jgi:hypothetical protein